MSFGSAIVLVVALFQTNCSSNMKIKTLPYPKTIREDVVDDYHGTKVADPYRWLEDDNAKRTAEWVAAENRVTFDYLSQIPYRTILKNRLTELYNYPRIGAPVKCGDYYFQFRNNGLQNQSVLYMLNSPDDSEPQEFLNPNILSDEGTVALISLTFADDGKHMAYALAQSGSDWVNIYVKEIPSGKLLPDKISWVKFSGASWAADSKGFYYSGYDKPEKGTELSGQNQNQKVYYHALGTPQSKDRLIYDDPKHPLRYLSGEDDGDKGNWIFISASEGTHGSEILYRRKNSNDRFRTLFKGFDFDYSIVRVEGDLAYVYTNDNAPNFRLIAIDLNNPRKEFRDILPENPEHLLERAHFAGDHLFATYLENATDKVYQYTSDGELIREISLPALGTVSGFEGKKDAEELFYTLTNFTAPASVYRYDLTTGRSELFSRPELPYDPERFVCEQVFYNSKDGTRIPMFLVHDKNLKKNGRNPVYLYAYGGFNINVTPGFKPIYIAFMEQGGVIAIPNIRGGGEYGEKWHRDGMLASKQNVFDDFIAAAEYLIAEKYTSPKKLAIAGGSNGGLLVGACMTQRPDLYAVALPAVGVMDMLRYHLFTCGWGWAVEYGRSDIPEQFRYLYKYSPLHNIRTGTCYPATLITTADHDDRVVPAHSFKFAATLQAAQSCDRPILIRIDTNAGHGAGKPIAKKIEEDADVLAFTFWNTKTNYVEQ